MPGVPEQPKPREEHGNGQKREEVESATQTDDQPVNGGTLSEKKVEELKKNPKVVVHSELQEELDKEIEAKGLHFDSPSKSEEGNDKQKAGDDKAE